MIDNNFIINNFIDSKKKLTRLLKVHLGSKPVLTSLVHLIRSVATERSVRIGSIQFRLNLSCLVDTHRPLVLILLRLMIRVILLRTLIPSGYEFRTKSRFLLRVYKNIYSINKINQSERITNFHSNYKMLMTVSF